MDCHPLLHDPRTSSSPEDISCGDPQTFPLAPLWGNFKYLNSCQMNYLEIVTHIHVSSEINYNNSC